MELTEEQLEELKQIELNILKDYIYVCNQLKLKYYVVGGTLLGAVRHKGFIPWDDDIDVAMSREDYEQFLEKAPPMLSKQYFLQHIENEPEYLMNFAKIRDCNTTFIESSIKDCKVNHGVYIDIFPLDIYPDKKWQRIWVDYRKKLLYGKIWFDLVKKKTFVKKLIVGLMPISRKQAAMKLEKLFKSVKKGHLIANYSGAWGKKEIMPAEWYGQGCELQFEGLTVVGPCQYDKWLTKVYGDYMTFPPVEKRVPHHFTEIVDLKKSYTEYMR